MTKLKIKKGDKVIVLAGADKGKQGKVLRVFPKQSKVLVAGVNIVKKHTKASQTSSGGIISMELPIHISNVAYFDSTANKATKIGFKILHDGKKVRIAKKSDSVVTEEGK